MSTDGDLPSWFFERDDEHPDAEFYGRPRLVTHIDDAAITAVGALYAELGVDGSDGRPRRVLDLMSSWVSHLHHAPSELVVLGMNALELAANPLATERVVHDLNADPALPFPDADFDAALCCVSIDYLTDPVAVLADTARVLRPGAPVIITFSDRCFPTKAVNAWLSTDDDGRCALVADYLRRAGGFSAASISRRTPSRGYRGDPLFAVTAPPHSRDLTTTRRRHIYARMDSGYRRAMVVMTSVRNSRERVEESLRPGVRWGLGHLLPRTMLTLAARRGDLQAKLIVNSGDQHELFEQMRDNGPVYKGRIGFMTTSLPVVREVLSSSDFRAGFDVSELGGPIGRTFKWAVEASTRLGPLEPPSLLVTEPPDHTRYRRLVTRVFTVRAVEQLRERTQVIADELLDQLEGRTDVDLVSEYCALLPVTVIGEILGVPASERDRILSFGEAAAPSLDLGLSWGQFRTVESALADFERWLDDHLRALRADPGEDLLSQLVQARDEGIGLSDVELKSIAGLVLAAGFETTVNLLSNGASLLCAHPDQLAALREDPTLWPNAVDEVLRFDPPVLLTGRTATCDTEVAGTTVRKGQRFTTLLAAANRDPEVFTDSHRFEVARPNARDHVSFSAGRHFCLGAALARMEGDVGLRTLFDRYPGLTQLDGATRRETRILRGFATLPVRLGPSVRVPV